MLFRSSQVFGQQGGGFGDIFGEMFGGSGRDGRDGSDLRSRVDGWRTSRIDLIRQYVRLLGSLVLFAEEEYGEAAADGGAP